MLLSGLQNSCDAISVALCEIFLNGFAKARAQLTTWTWWEHPFPEKRHGRMLPKTERGKLGNRIIFYHWTLSWWKSRRWTFTHLKALHNPFYSKPCSSCLPGAGEWCIKFYKFLRNVWWHPDLLPRSRHSKETDLRLHSSVLQERGPQIYNLILKSFRFNQNFSDRMESKLRVSACICVCSPWVRNFYSSYFHSLTEVLRLDAVQHYVHKRVVLNTKWRPVDLIVDMWQKNQNCQISL